MMVLMIKEDYRQIVTPLTAEERAQLEENILRDGVREPIVVWNNVIIDGHNRYEICKRHGLDFPVLEMEFETEGDAEIWLIKNQFGRRNIIDYQRSVLALRLENVISTKAKENSVRSGKDFGKGSQNSANPIEPVDTRKELAKMAGVSHDTIQRVKTIEGAAPELIRDAAAEGAISINKAYNATRAIDALPEAEQEDFREKLKATYDLPEPEQIPAVVEILKDLPKAQQNEGIGLLVNNSADIVAMEESAKKSKYFDNVLYKAFTLKADDGNLEAWLEGLSKDEMDASMEMLDDAIKNLLRIKGLAEQYIAEKSELKIMDGGIA